MMRVMSRDKVQAKSEGAGLSAPSAEGGRLEWEASNRRSWESQFNWSNSKHVLVLAIFGVWKD